MLSGENGSGDFLVVDLDPARGGTRGQIVAAWHDMAERVVVAESWADWLHQFADALEAGRWSWRADSEELVRFDEL